MILRTNFVIVLHLASLSFEGSMSITSRKNGEHSYVYTCKPRETKRTHLEGSKINSRTVIQKKSR